MSFQNNQSSVFQDEAKISALQNRVMTDAFALQIAEQVLTSIERLVLKAVGQGYDLSKIKDSLAEYKEACSENSETVSKIEFRLLQELQFWRLTLARRDEKVKAFHLRKYYDAHASSLTPKVLAGLACFYRGLMPTFEIRCKYDFVVTQLFSNKLPGKPRFVRIGQADLVERLQKFNYAWTGIESDWVNSEDLKRREDAVAVFEALRRELNNYVKLEELLKSGFFQRVLRHKQYLGENFYAPEVTAASIQYNVAVGNKFSQLVAAENTELQDLLKSEHGDAETINLILEEDPAQSKTLLKQINPEFTETEEIRDEEVDAEILNAEFVENSQENLETPANAEHSETVVETATTDAAAETAAEIPENELTETNLKAEPAQEKADEKVQFLQILSELNKNRPQENLLREYLSDSPFEDVKNLDLSLYFAAGDGSEREANLKRQALRLILIGEDYARRIVGVLPETVAENEVATLLEEMQSVGNEMRVCISVLNGDDKKENANALLTVSNDLLESRLRLNFIAAGISKKANLEASKRAKELNKTAERFLNDIRKNQPEESAPETKTKPESDAFNGEKKAPLISPGLLVLAILVVLIGGIYHYYSNFTGQTENEVVQSGDVQGIDLKTLRGAENLSVAKVNRKILIAVVKANWETIPPEAKRENLNLLLEQGSKFQYETVLLFNSKGDSVGNATRQEVKIK